MTGRNPLDEAKQIFHDRVQSEMLMCQIISAYEGENEADHNCLGCNLNSATEQISSYLELAAPHFDDLEVEQWYANVAFLINALWERISDVFEIIKLPDSYKCRHYGGFIRMRRWANFFKHPKGFGWLVHHPQCLIEESEPAKNVQRETDGTIIDDEFLKKYYCKDKVSGLAKELKQFPQKTFVILPDLPKVMEQICQSLHNFVDVVTKNPVYYEILRDEATIINFYESETVVTTTTTTTTAPSPRDECSS
ncbi:MAG: hypothetical protein ACC628_19975 [Pirellulaceae bacterium]